MIQPYPQALIDLVLIANKIWLFVLFNINYQQECMSLQFVLVWNKSL